MSATTNTCADVINQTMWNNKTIIIQKKSIFDKLLYSLSVVKIGDLVSETGNFLQSLNTLQAIYPQSSVLN